MVKRLTILGIILVCTTRVTFLGAEINEFERERFRCEIADERHDLEFDRREVCQMKFWDARLNKVITDIHGNRVRIEEFITRPEANQIKFTALSKRKNRLDYFWFLQEFNKNLPKDIREIAFRCEWSEYPEFYPVKQTSYKSNTVDSLMYLFQGQQPEEIEIRDTYGDIVGYLYFLFSSRVEIWVNGILKRATDLSTFEFEPAEPEWSSGEYENGGQWHQEDYYWNNTYFRREQYIINDSGEVLKIWFMSIQDIEEIYEKYNMESIYTASEFNGRTIDIILVPKLFLRYKPEHSLFGAYDPYLLF